MSAYYNEIEPFAAAWLRELIKAGHIAPGVVDERSIEDVCPNDLAGFTQCHFFAGIGVWSYALRCAGWPMTALSGREVAPVNLSPRQAAERGCLTSGTYGPRSSILLASAALSQSLANRLRQRTGWAGSTLFSLTWKEQVTPAGRVIPLLRASVRRISDSGFTGWPTPCSQDGPKAAQHRGRTGCRERCNWRAGRHRGQRKRGRILRL